MIVMTVHENVTMINNLLNKYYENTTDNIY